MLNIGAGINAQTVATVTNQENDATSEKSGFNVSLNSVRNTSEQRSDTTVNQANLIIPKNNLLAPRLSEYHCHLGRATHIQEETKTLPPSESTRQPKIKLYMHTTAEENLQHIHRSGLIAGGNSPAVAGMGDPEQGKQCTEGIYVVMPHSSIGTDARSGVVGIASHRSPTRDANYPSGKAGVFLTDKIPPLRKAAIAAMAATIEHPDGDQCPATPPSQYYSFVPEKISPNTKAGAAALYARQGMDLSPNSATKALFKELKGNYPIHTLDIPLSSSPEKIKLESQQSNSPLHNSVDPNNNNDLLFNCE